MKGIESLHKVNELLDIEKKKINEKKEKIYQVINLKRDFKYSVTDHALIQYLRRIELIPPSEARYKILTEVESLLNKTEIKILKGIPYKLISPSNIIFLIRDKRIITIEVNER